MWVLPAMLSSSQVSSVHCSLRASGMAAPASEHLTNGAASVGAAWQGSRAQRPPRQALTQIDGPSGSDPAGWGGLESQFSQSHSNAKAAALGATRSMLGEPLGLPVAPSMQGLPLSAASGHSFLGKAQLYVTVNRAPRDVACQVQPHRGLEADTIFGVFCTSGRPVSTQTPPGRSEGRGCQL